MDKREGLGLGVAAVGHLVLLAALSFGLLARPRPIPKVSEPMDVQLTDLVGLKSTAPVVATEPPAPSVAPAAGPPQEAAPAEPEPTPPTPKPAPPPPAPKPAPAKDVAPEPKPVADKPSPQKAKPAAAKPVPAPAKDAPARARSSLDSSLLSSLKDAARREGKSGTAPKATGSRLGKDFLKGVTDAGAGKGAAPRASVGQLAMNGLGAAIKRQVEPCYARKGVVGPGAERIKTVLRLRFNPDGSLATRPTMSEQTGLDDQNGRYARRASEVAIAAVMECVPLKLPKELYKGGWEDIEPSFQQAGQ